MTMQNALLLYREIHQIRTENRQQKRRKQYPRSYIHRGESLTGATLSPEVVGRDGRNAQSRKWVRWGQFDNCQDRPCLNDVVWFKQNLALLWLIIPVKNQFQYMAFNIWLNGRFSFNSKQKASSIWNDVFLQGPENSVSSVHHIGSLGTPA